MISFPIFRKLSVDGYSLYPGTDENPGLTATFQPGLTLIVGANGLGKTTLVHLLYRMLTGPNDISGLPDGELGNMQFDVAKLKSNRLRIFAARVHDEATHATARLTFDVGGVTFDLVRDLRQLRLVSLTIGGEEKFPIEDTFQSEILAAAGIASFSDFILTLRYLTFYFDDRRSLVWDATAQRQILRLLFLSQEESKTWVDLERGVLKQDSYVRNLRAQLSREEQKLAENSNAVGTTTNVREALTLARSQQQENERKLAGLQSGLEVLESERRSAQLNALKTSETRESSYRSLEQLRLRQIQEAFPSEAESAAYILSYLITSGECLACGSKAEAAVASLKAKIDQGTCIVCDSSRTRSNAHIPIQETNIAHLTQRLKAAEESVLAANIRRQDAEQAFEKAVAEIAELQEAVALMEGRISSLVRQLPPEEREMRAHQSALEAMQARLEVEKADLRKQQAAYRAHLDAVKYRIAVRKDEIKKSFESFASDFLIETCALIWTSRRTHVGQDGGTIDSPTFNVDMTGNDFNSPVRRDGAEQVSESQREFIDLAFRMALMQVSASDGRGSLVIDAPESSLDAVFAPRAASVLLKFGNPSTGNNLLVTSNLVDGSLIPALLKGAGIDQPTDSRVVNLFQVASPTAAIRQLRHEYDQALTRAFRGTNDGR
ncbi:AAA family ATPase [Melissospora conviva]|uniref:AAA family ATPase n=1 Tax=Melissospora conviva TaxID=3388432 RepID=UPI003C1F0314